VIESRQVTEVLLIVTCDVLELVWNFCFVIFQL